jgi:hypothetical protein
LGKRANTATALLCQNGLEHCKHLLGGLFGGFVAYKIGQFIAARIN